MSLAWSGFLTATHKNQVSNVQKELPRQSSGKESTCQCRRHKRSGFDPWVRKIPWRRKWPPTPVILAWRIPWTEEPGWIQFRVTKSRTGQPLSTMYRKGVFQVHIMSPMKPLRRLGKRLREQKPSEVKGCGQRPRPRDGLLKMPR